MQENNLVYIKLYIVNIIKRIKKTREFSHISITSIKNNILMS